MEISITELARRGIATVMSRGSGLPLTVTRRGVPVAVLMSPQTYETLVAAADRQVFVQDFDELAVLMRSRREELGWSLEEAARAADVGQRFVWDVEHGQSRPETPMLLDLAEALDITLLSFPARPRGPWVKQLEDPMSDSLPTGASSEVV